MQTTDGALQTDLVHDWTSSAGLVHYAALWFCAFGRKEAGDHAMTCLRRPPARRRQLDRQLGPRCG